MVSLVG